MRSLKRNEVVTWLHNLAFCITFRQLPDLAVLISIKIWPLTESVHYAHIGNLSLFHSPSLQLEVRDSPQLASSCCDSPSYYATFPATCECVAASRIRSHHPLHAVVAAAAFPPASPPAARFSRFFFERRGGLAGARASEAATEFPVACCLSPSRVELTLSSVFCQLQQGLRVGWTCSCLQSTSLSHYPRRQT